MRMKGRDCGGMKREENKVGSHRSANKPLNISDPESKI